MKNMGLSRTKNSDYGIVTCGCCFCVCTVHIILGWSV